MTAGSVAGVEQLPEPPRAVSWTEGNWFQVVLRLAWSPISMGAVAAGLILIGLAQLPGLYLGLYLVAWAIMLAVWAVFALDGANAAGPGWLASRWFYRWRHVDLGRLSSVRQLSAETFRLKDDQGGAAVLAMRRTNAVEVLNVVRKDLAKARKRGVTFPDPLSAHVDGRVT